MGGGRVRNGRRQGKEWEEAGQGKEWAEAG